MQPISSLPAAVNFNHPFPSFVDLPRYILQGNVANFLSFNDITLLLAASLCNHARAHKNIALHQLFTNRFLLEDSRVGYNLLKKIINALSLEEIEKFQRTLSAQLMVAPIILTIVLSLAEEQRVLRLLEIVTLRSDATLIPKIDNLLESILSKNQVVMALKDRAHILGCLPVNLRSYAGLLDTIGAKIQLSRNQRVDTIKRSGSFLFNEGQFEEYRSRRCFGRVCVLLMDVGYAALTLTFLTLSVREYQRSASIGTFGILFILFAAFASISMYSKLSSGFGIVDEPSCDELLTILLKSLFAYPITLGITALEVYVNCLILRIAYIENTVARELFPQIAQWVNNINVLGGQACPVEYQRAVNFGLPAEILGAIQGQSAMPTSRNEARNTFGAITGRFSHFSPVNPESTEVVVSPLNNV